MNHSNNKSFLPARLVYSLCFQADQVHFVTVRLANHMSKMSSFLLGVAACSFARHIEL